MRLPTHGHPDVEYSGLVHTYQRMDDVWVKGDVLCPEVPQSGDSFGFAIELDGDTALISAPFDSEHEAGAGAVYRFERIAGVWVQQEKLSQTNPHAYDYFGHSIGLSGQRALVGMPLDDTNGMESGAVFSLELGCAGCPADITGDGSLDIFDVFAFIKAFNASDPVADFVTDSIYDIFDVFAFIEAFNTGCP